MPSAMENASKDNDGKVRKRAPNACQRCRKQKIKCSGAVPCEQCSKRSLHCAIDTRQQKILVSQSYVTQLEQQVAGLSRNRAQFAHNAGMEDPVSGLCGALTGTGADDPGGPTSPPGPSINDVYSRRNSESEGSHPSGLRATPEPGLTNPLDPSNSDSFTVNTASRHYFLGVSSNWSFGRRVLRMVHERVHGVPLSAASLLFEGSTYDLGWDGHRTSVDIDTSSLPTADFALFLINAVKFHCGRLFHIFDETVFMHHFSLFYEDPENQSNYPRLWYVHFLLVLAFGKAFIVRASKGKRPPGAELFVQAMQLLPDTTFLYSDAIQSIEVLCCASLYLQCLDLRSAAYNVIGQALRMAVEQGMHTDMCSPQLSKSAVERCREAWWTVYCLDRHLTSTMGVPMGLSDDDITAPLPTFAGSARKVLAQSLHVKLSKATAIILQTVYGKTGGRSERFLTSMKEALRTIAQANDERNTSFPLDLRKPGSGICRLTAYLHLFHHQSLILATRPLLYSFLQKRLQSNKPLRVSPTRGARSLIRVCVGSAQQCLSILEALQSQSLLESFIPFDRDAAFSSAVVLTVSAVVDPSLLRDKNPRLDIAYRILDEMIGRGNLIAEYNKRELEQLEMDITRFLEMTAPQAGPQTNNVSPSETYSHPTEDQSSLPEGTGQPSTNFTNLDTILSEWNSEDGLSGEHLLAVADSLDFSQLNWLATGEFDQSAGMLY